MAVLRTHIVQVISGDMIITRCGKKAFKSGFPNEYDTADCNRIHAVPHGTTGEEEPTCKRCLKPSKPRPLGTYAMPRYF